MLTEKFFLTISFVVSLSIVMYKTNFMLYYSNLFNILPSLRSSYALSVSPPETYQTFLMFLLSIGTENNNRFVRFVSSLIKCPLCLMFWVSLTTCGVVGLTYYTFACYFMSVLLFLLIERLSQSFE